jgi:hypothetical protein
MVSAVTVDNALRDGDWDEVIQTANLLFAANVATFAGCCAARHPCGVVRC